jgi:arylformamidase
MAKLIDVTVPLSAGVPTFPGDPRYAMEFVHKMSEGKPYNVAHLSLGAHSGTHVDAPYHFLAHGATVEQLPLPVLMGRARVVAVSARQGITREELAEVVQPDDVRILLKTRNSGRLLTDAFMEDFVHLTAGAAEYLVHAGVKLVGIDYLSVEKFGSTDFPVHHTLLGAGVVIVEGLDLTDAEPGEYDMACLPLRLVGADGSPARVVLRTRP